MLLQPVLTLILLGIVIAMPIHSKSDMGLRVSHTAIISIYEPVFDRQEAVYLMPFVVASRKLVHLQLGFLFLAEFAGNQKEKT